MPKRPKNILARPSSYSESFIDVERDLEPLPLTLVSLQEISDIQGSPTIQSSPDSPKRVNFAAFIVKSSIHLFLISVFETIFFFTYVAGKEDNGIEGTIDTYYTPIKKSCPSWSNTTRWIVYEILSNGQEIQKITSAGINSYNSRMKINSHLLYYSLGSSLIFLTILGIVVGALIYRGSKIKWVKTICENVMMVLLLGLYEYIFFMAIIYNYNSISTNELNSYIANGIYDCVKS